jgi:hypothetical protein
MGHQNLCNGCQHNLATHGNGWTQVPGHEEPRAFVLCRLYGRVYMSKHWNQGDPDQPVSFVPNGCPKTQMDLAI